MALFENFPYTNLHELNLDWLIQQMQELEEKVHDGPVVSVNGLTGEVVLYREAHIQLPDVTDTTITTWDIFRYLNGNIYGIQFDVNGNVYALKDNVRTKLLTWADIPADAGVISVNGLYGVVHLSGTDIPYMGGETETVYDKLSDLDDDITSAQADINDLTVTMGTIDNAIKRGIAYLESTDTATNNIPTGKYVFWKNYPYISTSAISVGDALSTTNLTAVATGGFINALQNELQTQINTLNSNIINVTEESLTYTNEDNKSVIFYFRKCTVVLSVIVNKGDHALKIPTTWTSIGTLPTFRPVSDRYIPVVVPSGDTVMVKITTSGGVLIQSTSANDIWMQGSGTVIMY